MPLRVYYTPSERGPYMKVAFTIKPSKKGGTETREFKIDDTARISFKFVQRRHRNDNYSSSSSSTNSELGSTTPISISISLKKVSSMAFHPSLGYVTRMKIRFLGFNGQLLCPDTWTEWIDMGKVPTEYDNELLGSYNSIQLEASMTAIRTENIKFLKLYDDTITTDFSITTKDGDAGLAFHRNCLLSHSDMFKTLFQSGDFADKKVFKVGIKEVTDETIKQLKEYVYLGKLPEDDVRPLLLLAKCYLFDNLQAECITKIAETVNCNNLHSLMAFACENNIPDLAISLMQQTPEDVVYHAHVLDRRRKRKWDEDVEPERTGNKKHKKLMSTIHKESND